MCLKGATNTHAHRALSSTLIFFFGHCGLRGGTRLLPESLGKHSSKVRAVKELETLRAASYSLSLHLCKAPAIRHCVKPSGQICRGQRTEEEETAKSPADKETHHQSCSTLVQDEAGVFPPGFHGLDFHRSSALLPGADGLSGEQVVGYRGKRLTDNSDQYIGFYSSPKIKITWWHIFTSEVVKEISSTS